MLSCCWGKSVENDVDILEKAGTIIEDGLQSRFIVPDNYNEADRSLI